jgi:hypothetical protein
MKKYQAPPCPDGLYEFVVDCKRVSLATLFFLGA